MNAELKSQGYFVQRGRVSRAFLKTRSAKVIDKTACNEVQDKGKIQKERDDAR